MPDITELLAQYKSDVKIRYEKSGTFIALPFYHVESEESIALRFSETEDGSPVVTDCGTTKDYLESRDISLEAYREKVNAVKERFGIEEENGAFIMTMPTDSSNAVKRHLGYFIQAISIIANIDL